MSTPSLTDTDFAVLGIPKLFEQDEAFLAQRWKDLQTQMHPDRFSSQGQATQRLATQWSIRINEAYQRIKNPVTRASLLCELADVPIDSETNTHMPTDFLLQQIQWREALEDAKTVDQINEVQSVVTDERMRSLSTLGWLIDEKGDFQQAAQQVRALMFMDKFIKNINTKLNAMDA